MRLNYLEWSIREQFPIKALAIVVILVLGLLGGLLHHHESEGDFDACSYCHAGFLRPVIDLTVALAATTFAVVGLVASSRSARLPRVVHFSTLVPRAPSSRRSIKYSLIVPLTGARGFSTGALRQDISTRSTRVLC